jgi:pimeloyl-ACP methyl ester carboxylesterase
MSSSIIYEQSHLSFQKTGYGNKVLLLFHGFGQHKQIFDALSTELESCYTLYSFDLFFHGTSSWNHGEQALEKETWRAILQQFLRENKIEKFDLLGFSLGGKFVLATLELFPEKIDRIFLLAPDGIKTNIWYSLATYPLLLRQFFKSMILRPNRLNQIATFLQYFHLADKGLIRFAQSQMDTQSKRERVYYSWVVFRHLNFDSQQMAQLINSHSIKLTLITGRYDKIITPENMNRLLHFVKDYQLEILETGHNGVIPESIPIITKSLKF